MDTKELKKLLEILSDSEVTKFEMEKEGIKLKLSRGSLTETPIVQMTPPPAPDFQRQIIPAAPPASAVPAQQAAPAPAPAPAAEDTATKGDDDILNQDGIHIVTSPIVGTFYRKPNPNADPFVDIGDHVKDGQTLCIVEAMKLMNEITADAGGEIVKIFNDDAQPVEFGEPLFAIKTK